jgi:hypothetical protein
VAALEVSGATGDRTEMLLIWAYVLTLVLPLFIDLTAWLTHLPIGSTRSWCSTVS